MNLICFFSNINFKSRTNLIGLLTSLGGFRSILIEAIVLEPYYNFNYKY